MLRCPAAADTGPDPLDLENLAILKRFRDEPRG